MTVVGGFVSLYLLDRIEDELVWLCCRAVADVFIGRETARRLDAPGEVVGRYVVQLVVVVVTEPPNRRLPVRPVTPLDPTVRPRIVRLGRPIHFKKVFGIPRSTELERASLCLRCVASHL
jgi:hypothetical protein